MPTTNYKYQIESFLRKVGEGEYTIDLANINTSTSGLKRYKLPIIYDYFWDVGIKVFDIVKLMSYDKIFKAMPRLVTEETVTLTSNVASSAISADLNYLFKNGLALRTSDSVKLNATLVPDNRYYDIQATTPIYTVSEDKPEFILNADRKIAVYPMGTPYTNIKIRYLKNVTRLELSNDANINDIWNVHIGRLIVEGAVAEAKADAGNYSAVQLFESRLEQRLKALLMKENVDTYTDPLVVEAYGGDYSTYAK